MCCQSCVSVAPWWWPQVIADLEEERRRHAEDTAEGDDVTYILEKERERLLQQVGPSPHSYNFHIHTSQRNR